MRRTLIVFLCAGLMGHVSRTMAGGHESGGGDPLRVMAYPFPNEELLQGAVSHLREEIKKKKLPAKFVVDYLADLDALMSAPPLNFFYVPGLASFGYQRHPGDYGRGVNEDGSITLISIGAFTEFRPKAPIFFTDRATTYGPKELARVIAQEIPHHLSMGPRTALHNFTCTNKIRYHKSSENFVNRLGAQVATQDKTMDKDIVYALELIYAEECFTVIEAIEALKSAAVTKLYSHLSENLDFKTDMAVQDLIGKVAFYNSTDNDHAPDVMEVVALRLWLEDFEKTDDVMALTESFKRHFTINP